MNKVRRKRTRHPINNPVTGYLFILPQFLFFAVFTLYPVIEGFRISLYRSNARGDRFVGLANYIQLFSDEVFLQSIRNTLLLVVVVVGATLILGFVISWAIFDKNPKYVALIRSCYYLPVIVSAVVMAMVWNFLLNPASGLVNYILKLTGSAVTNPLGDKNIAIWIIAFVTVVSSLGQAVIMYVASMIGISGEIFEAAEVDGATKVERGIHIIAPLTKSTTLYLAVMNTISVLKLFVIVQLLTDGGPNNASMTMMYYLYRNAFIFDKMNVAAAIGVIMFLLAFIMAIPQFRAFSRQK